MNSLDLSITRTRPSSPDRMLAFATLFAIGGWAVLVACVLFGVLFVAGLGS